MIKNIEKATT